MIGNVQSYSLSKRIPDCNILCMFADSDISHEIEFSSFSSSEKSILLKTVERTQFTGKKTEMSIVHTEKASILLCGMGDQKNFSASDFQSRFTEIIRYVRKNRYKSVEVSGLVLKKYSPYERARRLSLGLALGNYEFLTYKSKKEQKEYQHVELVLVHILDNEEAEFEKGSSEGKAVAEAGNLVRTLVNEPGSHVHPETLVKTAFEIEARSKGRITVSLLEEDECRKKGMGAYLAVGKGSEHPLKFIVLELKEKTDKSARHPLCLIGKSVTFDSGGLSLKPSKAMEDMKIDMAGGATVLGVFSYFADHSSPISLVGILPACENMPSGSALRPGDVVQACNGKTIEVVNTDAEGRLTLADALSFSEKEFNPSGIVDLATLTGACMVALGTDIAGVFGSEKKFTQKFLSHVFTEEGDTAWELPLYKSYAYLMKSSIAELKNVTGTGYGGAITAALFLSEFVEKTPWIHVDIAGPAHNGGSARGGIPSGGTGWGVQTIISFIKSYERFKTS